MAGGLGRRDGRAFLFGLGGWGVLRATVSTSWRDQPIVAGLNAGSLIAILVVLVSIVGLLWVGSLRPRRQERAERAAVRWAEPEAPPRF